MAGKYDRAKPNQETSCSSLLSSSQITESKKRGKVKSEEAEANEKGNVVPRKYTLTGSRQESVSTVTPAIERRRDGFDSSRMWQDVMTAGLNDIGRLHQIKKFVKDNLFPHVKFFVSEHELGGVWHQRVFRHLLSKVYTFLTTWTFAESGGIIIVD